MFRTLAHSSLVAAVLLASAISAHAGPVDFDDIDVEFWIGDGQHEAIIVVDWKGLTPGQIYAKAFGFRWNGEATGVDVLNALDAEPTFYREWAILGGNVSNFIGALGWDASGDGVMDGTNPDPDDWFEAGYGSGPPPHGWTPGYWAHFWWLPDEDAWIWDPNDVKILDPLVPGQLDGWSWDALGPPPEDVVPDIPTKDDPDSDIPEPATCLLVGLGVATLACKTRRRFL